ncbi:pyridoxamine 5'-phosphate oxidase family protein [Archangium primigenium]|uniref:pyridoxamine 5'-phosphate oxidase family protein n=1 Tax=[Archangium] primigenium TaxID=2792470 RepID=UPI00195EF5EA|nr:pyridoxamine 5'-phosphate oxidase family protein [Archangium primigenium]MBM7115096.1 pyridoxamine 5'-phosphate oxidase family protein [Archangium primigenium]
MRGSITSVTALEDCVGAAPAVVNLKVIDHLDAGALRWLAASPLVFAGFGEGPRLALTLGGGAPGFAGGEAHELRLPLALLDDPTLARPGRSFGALFLLPGVCETLRVNGRVTQADQGELRVAVEECFGHCAKALLRSDFWKAAPVEAPLRDPEALVATSRFMALATVDAHGRMDLSPRGDPAGALTRLDEGRLWFADRPGNRRVDSFRNILAQPQVAALLLVPGSPHVAHLSGRAWLTTDDAVRARFVVQDKTPTLAIGVDEPRLEPRESPALVRARLWPAPARPEGLEPSQIFVEHVKLNSDKGLGARLASAALSVPGVTGLLRKGLEKDYKTNLY